MVKVLEACYKIPLRTSFSTMMVPEMYTRGKVVTELSKASSVAVTTDRWPSLTTESCVTVHYHRAERDMRSALLQTRPPERVPAQLLTGVAKCELEAQN